jgi:hypothetical protein
LDSHGDNQTERYEEYMEFKNDIHGRPLRYKVLVRDMAVARIMYNTGSSIETCPFEEFRVQEGDLMVVTDASMGGGIDKVVCRVTKVPVGNIACEESATHLRDSLAEGTVENPLTSHCMNRHFNELPGYVDVNVLSHDGLTTVNPEAFPCAISCCNLKSADPCLEVILTSMAQAQVVEKVGNVENVLCDLRKIVENYLDPEFKKEHIECSMDALKAF